MRAGICFQPELHSSQFIVSSHQPLLDDECFGGRKGCEDGERVLLTQWNQAPGLSSATHHNKSV